MVAKSGDTNLLIVLLRSGADVNAVGDSKTALHVAAFYGQEAIVKFLLEEGAHVNTLGFRHKNTPLQIAALHGHIEVVKLLIERRADINAKDTLNRTALSMAAGNKHSNIVAELLKHGAK